ncbi:MAG: glycosyltransferase family 39 protein, partial [Bdellovibrionales bacterium]|nr:glycosyltransferase family 39 protein [Bdellovibrionales bacterium]
MKLNESSPIGQSQHSLSRTGVVALFFVGFAYFAFLALNRFIAADEGFYLLAAREVMSGRDLYLDFFYPQMPLLPIVGGMYFAVFGHTWIAARLACAILTIAIGALVYFRVRRESSHSCGLIASTLFFTSYFSLCWFTTYQTYALSTLFLFTAYYLIERSHTYTYSESSYSSLSLMIGLSLGLAISTRLFFAGTTPLVAALVIRRFGARPA